MPKPIDDTLMLDNMAEAILQGRAHTQTGAMRLYGVEDGSADERRLLRKWKEGGGVKAMERMAVMLLDATVERHREELSQHGFREYERGYHAGGQVERDRRDAAMIAGTSALAQRQPQCQPQPRKPSLWARMIGVAG